MLLFFHAFLIFTGPACTFLSGSRALSTPLALSRPWGVPHAKGCGVVGVMCEPGPWGVERCRGGHPLSVHSHPEPFRSLKSSASRGGRNWEEPGGKVMAPVPGSPDGGQPGARGNPGAGGKRGVIPVLFFPSNLLVFKC